MVIKLGAIIAIICLIPLGISSCSTEVSLTRAVKTSPANQTGTASAPAPFPPVSQEISWDIGNTTVSATITRPDDSAIHPAVVFVAGSGPTDRNWNSTLLPGTNGSAALLAAELARAGFVTLRYDKRVTGPNAQKNLPLLIGQISMESHLDELAGAVGQLLARPEVNPAKIFVAGNSEGTIHAMNYQLERLPKFAGLVLLAPPGRNMADLTRSQIQAQLSGIAGADAILAGYDKLMANFLAGRPFVADAALPDGINNLVQSFYIPANLPFARELFLTDPASLLAQINSPALVVIGKKDIQVDWQADGSLLEKAAQGKANVTFVYPENANHVVKNEPRPRSALNAADALTYNAPDRVLDADALKAIKDWLGAHK